MMRSMSQAIFDSRKRSIGAAVYTMIAVTCLFMLAHGWRAEQHRQVIQERAVMWYTIINGLPGGVALASADTGEILGWNAGMYEIFGISREEALGRRMYDLEILPADYRARHKHYFGNDKIFNRVVDTVTETRGQAYDINGKSIDLHVEIRAFRIADTALYMLSVDPARIIRPLESVSDS
jgi:PAS domain S-box-containing protein